MRKGEEFLNLVFEGVRPHVKLPGRLSVECRIFHQHWNLLDSRCLSSSWALKGEVKSSSVQSCGHLNHPADFSTKAKLLLDPYRQEFGSMTCSRPLRYLRNGDLGFKSSMLASSSLTDSPQKKPTMHRQRCFSAWLANFQAGAQLYRLKCIG